MKIFIYGSGAHAIKAFECALAMRYEVAGFISDDAKTKIFFNKPVLNLNELSSGDSHKIFIAIGKKEDRQRIFLQLKKDRWEIPSLIHPTAVVSTYAQISAGVFVGATSVVGANSVIGEGAILDIGVLVDHDVHISEFAHIKPGSVLLPGTKA